MITGLVQWILEDAIPLALTAVCTHLVVSGGQTFLHYSLGHHRVGGVFFRNHIKFHHGFYTKGHLVSSTQHPNDGNNTPYFLIPTTLVAVAMFFLLPLDYFIVVAASSAASFYVHVYFDREYHIPDSKFARFAWFRHMQQLHFVHHLHANRNFAVIDFYWDRLFGTFRTFDRDTTG